MNAPQPSLLIDSFARIHRYLRISVTEHCNLRCAYCMPHDGIKLSPRSSIMTVDEIYTIASTFVKHGITKIRLTGGEPLVRKDISIILQKLASLPVELAITTNAVTVDRFVANFKACNVQNVNVSLDSLNRDKFKDITHRGYFETVWNNILLLIDSGFRVKINVVLIRGFNDDEIIDFIQCTKDLNVVVRFIEFMPFDNNRWGLRKMVSLSEILQHVNAVFSSSSVLRIADSPNDTSKNYKISNYKGSFAIISPVSHPFCDSCNRLRLTANGRLKNCLFSSGEVDLLSNLRKGKNIVPLINKELHRKFKIRGGLVSLKEFSNPQTQKRNRSMVAIGG